LSAIPTTPALPGYLSPIPEPTGYGTKLTRITDKTAFGITDPDDYAVRHGYPKVQHWNSDSTRLALPSGADPLLDGNDYSIVRSKNTFSAGYARWSHSDPNTLYKPDGSEFRQYTINPNNTTQTYTNLRTFTGYYGLSIGGGEGNLSLDDRYVALMARNTNTTNTADAAYDDLWVIIYDVHEDTIKSVTPFYDKYVADLGSVPRSERIGIDFVSMSPSGQYIVMRWRGNGTARYKGVEVYTLPAVEGDPLVFSHQITPVGSHGDLGYDAAGHEVWVATESDDTNYPGVGISTYRLDNGAQTTQLSQGGSGAPFQPGHISCQNYKRPGWVYVTLNTNNTVGALNPAQTMKEVFALKLDGSETVQRFAWTYNNHFNYSSESHGVPNPDGTKVMFASNWGGTSSTSMVYSYVAEWAQIPESTTYQAEVATLSGGTYVETTNSGYHSTGYVNFQASSSVQFTGVNGLGGGGKTLTIRYANGSSSARPGQVVVNGGTPISINMQPTGAFSNWSTIALPITLNNNSTNTITISSIGSDLGNVDEITVADGQPVFTTHPTSQTVTAGANVTFSVSTTASPAPSYQWQRNGVNVSGATSATLTITNVQATHAGTYVAIASNSNGVTTSNPATLTVNVPPTITTQPSAQTALVGSNVTFTVAATGTPTLSYQWKKGSNNISGATSSTLNLTNVQTVDAANYSVVVTNMAGTTTSNTAFLTVQVPPSITTQPVSQTVTAGANVTFTVVASGTPAPTYQWKKGSNNIVGATSSTLTLTNVQPISAANYSCVVTNAAGTVTSNNAFLTVNVLTYQAENATLSGGNSAETNVTGYNGTGFVNSSVTGGSTLFSNVNGQGGGTKTLVIRYSNGSTSRTGQLVVNGGTPVSLTTPSTGAFSTWTTMNVTITLNNNSTNTIALNSTGNDLGNVDEITIQ
jgi:hypothetical protein